MHGTARQRLLTTILVAASTLILAGCFTIESKFTISDEGTVDIEMVMLIDTESLTEFSSLLGQDLDGLGDLSDLSGEELINEMTGGENPCGEITGSLVGYEVTTREISDGSTVGFACTVVGVPIEDITDLGADTLISIEQDESGTQFELQLIGADQITGGDDLTELMDIDLDELVVVKFSVSAPGSLGENNATSTDGSTATWTVTADAPFMSAGTAIMTASWSPSGSGSSSSSAVWIIAAVIATIAVIAIIVVVLRKRGNGDDPGEPAAPGAPMAAPPSSPATTSPPSTPPPPTMTPPPATPPSTDGPDSPFSPPAPPTS